MAEVLIPVTVLSVWGLSRILADLRRVLAGDREDRARVLEDESVAWLESIPVLEEEPS